MNACHDEIGMLRVDDPRTPRALGRIERKSIRLLLGAAAAALALCACRGRKDEGPPAPAASAKDQGVRRPTADALAPGELAEGTDEAFGLPIPRGMVIEHRFRDVVTAKGAVVGDVLTTYVQRHLVGSTVEMGKSQTIFRGARLKETHAAGDPAASQRVLQVEILRRSEGVVLTVRDRTPPPAQPGLDDAERWRRAGMDPSGKIIDPTQMQ